MSRLSSPLLWIAVITVGPLLLALAANFGLFGEQPFPTLANADRELFAPPVPLPEVALQSVDGGALPADWARYRWSLIYARMSPCEAACEQDLERLRQVHAALGRDQDRVQRVLLTTDSAADGAVSQGFLVGDLQGTAGRALIELLGRQRIENGRVFVVDPLGNLVLSYPADADQRRVLDDLERLLDVSKVG